jgi:transcription factor C subunit 7
LEEIHARVENAVREIVKVCDMEGVRAVLLCTHAATNIALGRALTDNPEVATGEVWLM